MSVKPVEPSLITDMVIASEKMRKPVEPEKARAVVIPYSDLKRSRGSIPGACGKWVPRNDEQAWIQHMLWCSKCRKAFHRKRGRNA